MSARTAEMVTGMSDDYRKYQSRADHIAQQFGDSAPRWQEGERILDYRRRLLAPFQQHSPDWAKQDLSRADWGLMDLAEKKILADAEREARAPTKVPPGRLVERFETDRAGRRISKFFGDQDVTWGPFKHARRFVAGIGGQ